MSWMEMPASVFQSLIVEGGEGETGVGEASRRHLDADSRRYMPWRMEPEASELPQHTRSTKELPRRIRLKHGELVNVSAYAAGVGFLVPVALSSAAWSALVDVLYDLPLMDRNPRMRERRLLDVLIKALHAARKEGNGNSAEFSMYRFTSNPERKATGKVAVKHDLLILCGPGDRNEPVITILLKDSDPLNFVS